MKLIRKEHIYPIENCPIPPSCHASTLIRLKDGTIAAAWFAGTNESDPDVCIWFATFEGNSWGAPVCVTPDNNMAHWNPVLFLDEETNTIWLFYKEGTTPRTWYTLITKSTDDGATRSEPELLVEDDESPRGPVKNKMIELSDGTWLAPTSYESLARCWMLFMDRSEDKGKTWQQTDFVPMKLDEASDVVYTHVDDMPEKSYGLIQPTLWEELHNPGHVHLLARSSLCKVYRADSTDYGKTWSRAYPIDLPNNNSGLDVVRTDDGTLALIYNPVSGDWAERTPISVSLSRDNGETWTERIDLETIPGEYSYPAIIADGNKLYMTYTYQRKTVEFAIIEL